MRWKAGEERVDKNVQSVISGQGIGLYRAKRGGGFEKRRRETPIQNGGGARLDEAEKLRR